MLFVGLQFRDRNATVAAVIFCPDELDIFVVARCWVHSLAHYGVDEQLWELLRLEEHILKLGAGLVQ